jgi:hypothetical protein
VFLTKADNWVFGTPTGGNPFRPQGTGGKLFIDSYDHDRARCAVVCQGFLYPRIMSAVGNVLLNA